MSTPVILHLPLQYGRLCVRADQIVSVGVHAEQSTEVLVGARQLAEVVEAPYLVVLHAWCVAVGASCDPLPGSAPRGRWRGETLAYLFRSGCAGYVDTFTVDDETTFHASMTGAENSYVRPTVAQARETVERMLWKAGVPYEAENRPMLFEQLKERT